MKNKCVRWEIIPACTATLPSAFKKEGLWRFSKPLNCKISLEPKSTSSSWEIGTETAASTAAAAAEDWGWLLDQEAATIWATPMLLQFLLALLLSCLTKFGGNLRIKDEIPNVCLGGRKEKGVVFGWELVPESERHLETLIDAADDDGVERAAICEVKLEAVLFE